MTITGANIGSELIETPDNISMRNKSVLFILLGVIIAIANSCDDQTTMPTELSNVTIVNPKEGATVADSITVIISAGDLAEVERIDLFIDDDSVYSDFQPPYSYFWSTHNVSSGQNHTLTARAVLEDTTYTSPTTTVTVQLESGFHIISEFNITGIAVAVLPDAAAKYLFVASSDDGVGIYDISSLYSPQFIASIATNGKAVDIELDEDYLFVAEEDNGVTVWDISNPENAQYIDIFDTPGIASKLRLDTQNRYLYIIDNSSVQIVAYDSSYHFGNSRNTDLGVGLNDVAVNSGYAHVGGADGVRFLEIANPLNPVPISTVYSTDTPVLGIVSIDSLDFLAKGTTGIDIFSFSNIFSPQFKAEFNTTGNSKMVAVENVDGYHIIYVADGVNGVGAYRYADNGSPSITSLSNLEVQGNASDIVYHQGLIFVADYSRFMILRYEE
ncbi:MAG: hypothetical protein GF315_02160 [candidate division Zixibacteria bacterium]|nr:hypothetical protein [candidate division Zixibacteria bacterium]